MFDGHDGIAFVSHRGVRFVDAKRDELFETDGPVEGLHFAGAATLRFAVGREVLEWDAEKGTKNVGNGNGNDRARRAARADRGPSEFSSGW